MEGEGSAGTYRATLHRCWTWRVADSFSCLTSVGLVSIGGPNASFSCSMAALTLVAKGQVVILWSAFPHIKHRLFSQFWLASSGLSLPSGPKNQLSGWGGHEVELSCLVGYGGCWEVRNGIVGGQGSEERGEEVGGLNSCLWVNFLSSILSQ